MLLDYVDGLMRLGGQAQLLQAARSLLRVVTAVAERYQAEGDVLSAALLLEATIDELTPGLPPDMPELVGGAPALARTSCCGPS